KRWKLVLTLCGDAKRLSTGSKYAQPGASRHESRDVSRGGDHLLEVVNEQKTPFLTKTTAELPVEAQGVTDSRHDHSRVPNRCEANKPHAGGELVGCLRRGGKCKPRLPDAARACDCHDPVRITKSLNDVRNLSLPANERVRRHREIGLIESPQPSEVAFA